MGASQRAEDIVLRMTDDPAPRLLYCFTEDADGKIRMPELVGRVNSGDIKPEELYIGGKVTEDDEVKSLQVAHKDPGVKAVVECFLEDLKKTLEKK